MTFIESMKEKAKKDIKTIILPESEDIRVLESASKVLKEGFANIILIGDENNVQALATQNNINIAKAQIINPKTSNQFEEYANYLYELRKEKGVTLEKAKEMLLEPIYFGTMMLKQGKADGLVSGACHSTANTLRPALQILKTKPNTKLVSAFFVMVIPNCEYGENGVFIFSDCGLVENPDAEQLAEIAISSSKSFEQLTQKEAKVAMLSYSTHGSANSSLTSKVLEATNLVKQNAPSLICDGELQLDAAIIPEIAATKAPNSIVAGKANTLVFPDLNAGNIGYKLVQRLAKAEAYGPLCQGISKPVNDLSRGCSADDISGVIAITCVQAQTSKE